MSLQVSSNHIHLELRLMWSFRYLKRIIPLTGTTHATLPALTTLCPSVLSEGFRSHSDTPLTVRLSFALFPSLTKHRSSGSSPIVGTLTASIAWT